jgi:ribosomal protein S18 acetylase RimI-like enzyme
MKDIRKLVGLRLASADDEPLLRQIYASTRVAELSAIPLDSNQKQAFIDMQFMAQRRQYDISYPLRENRIILFDREPAGRLLVDRSEPMWTLVDIALLPAYQNRGIGTLLLDGLLREAAAAGKSVKLHVVQSNPAKNLYERLGFSEVTSSEVYCEMKWSPT